MKPDFNLRDFDISDETGFVPPAPLLTRLRHESFCQWEDLLKDTPKRIDDKTFRDKVGCV